MSQLAKDIIEAMQRQAVEKQRPCVVSLEGYEFRCTPKRVGPPETFFLVNGCYFAEGDVKRFVSTFAKSKPIAATAVLNALKAVES